MNSYENIRRRLHALKCAVLIPTYNNAGTIARVVDGVRRYCDDVLVINDGSTDSTREILDGMPSVMTLSYDRNRGKGHALRRGFEEAARRGYRAVITIDADGQHYAEDLEKFAQAAEQTPDTLLIGARCLTAENMPSKNTFANKFSNFWYRVETGRRLDDTQSGFRYYPLDSVAGHLYFSTRYEFEVEVIVRAAWRGTEVRNIPIRVYYPPVEERVSHFRPGKDFTRISILNTFLVMYALLIYYPFRFMRWFSWTNLCGFVDRHILHAPQSNAVMAASVAWGVMWGMMPVWGWQAVAAVAAGHFMRLNKVVVFAATNISIPPMIPFIVFGGYVLGAKLLGGEINLAVGEISMETLAGSLIQYIAGSIVLALIGGGVTYMLCRGAFALWRKGGRE